MTEIIETPSTLEERNACAVVPCSDLVKDLLAMIRYDLSLDRSKTAKQVNTRISGLVCAVNDIARSLNTTPEQLTVDEVVESESTYLQSLSQSCTSSGSRRRRSTYRNVLLRYAHSFGFSPASFSILMEWEPIMAVLAHRGTRAIAADAIRRKRYPGDFSEKDLASWANVALGSGRTIVYVRRAKAEFVRAIRNAGIDFHRRFPRLDLNVRRLSAYRLRTKDMPESVRDRIFDAINARRAMSKLGIVSTTLVTERAIILCFERLCGYAIRVCGMNVADLDPLLDETFIRDFAFWLHGNRKYKRASVVHNISLIFSTLRCSPQYQGRDFDWVYDVLRKIRKEPDSGLKARRRQRHVEFNKLAAVPGRIATERTALQDSSPTSAAWLAHDELLLSCLILAQYPSQFVRQARLGTNLFKGLIPKDNPPFKLPAWAKEVLASDPGAEFWQFRHESNDGQVFRGLVLRAMIPLLEQYLNQFRPLLIATGNRSDPGTVFFNRALHPMSPYTFGQHLVRLTYRYLGKCVTPTAIRSSFAYHWRRKHPGMDAVLANIQWIQFATIKLRYDEQFRLQQRTRANCRKNRYA